MTAEDVADLEEKNSDLLPEIGKGLESPLVLFDAHAHLASAEFARDLPAVLARARQEGVCGILAVGENVEEGRRTLELAAGEPLIKPAVGFDPTRPDLAAAREVMAFARAHAGRWAALGEVGLDHWMVQATTDRQIQETILSEFTALSLELDLPLNVHSRSAGRRTIQLLREAGARAVLLHAFDGRAATALEGVQAGYYFSIPPSVVRSPQKQKLVRRLPLDCLLLETDAPVLGPDPTSRNEPANVRLACQAVAALRGLTAEAVAEVTTANARRLFPRAFAAPPGPL